MMIHIQWKNIGWDFFSKIKKIVKSYVDNTDCGIRWSFNLIKRVLMQNNTHLFVPDECGIFLSVIHYKPMETNREMAEKISN